MVAEAAEVRLAVECGAVRQAVLHRAAEYGVGVDQPVGGGHDPSVEVAGRPCGRGAVVFHGFAHERDGRGREEAAQHRVGGEDFARDQVVAFTSRDEARVVVGRDDVGRALVGAPRPGQCEAALDDAPHVCDVVRLVEMRIAGDDLRFYVVFQCGVCHGDNVSAGSDARCAQSPPGDVAGGGLVRMCRTPPAHGRARRARRGSGAFPQCAACCSLCGRNGTYVRGV